MSSQKSSITDKTFAQDLLRSADIIINGSRPWDIQIHNEAFYKRVLSHGSLGLGESYMDQWWDCERLDVFFEKVLSASLDQKIKIPFRVYLKHIFAYVINFQSKFFSKDVAKKHYDLGNLLFKNMLDSHMMYSCAYWKTAHTLEDAQQAKLELTCKKLFLKSGMHLLDIGCGWGGLAKYAAEHYGVKVTGITISQQQCDYAKNFCKGLPIDIRLQDYRDIHESFDRIVSIGMFEHVGHKNYDAFMKVVNQNLKNNGLFLLHTIGTNFTTSFTDAWIIKYIFPHGMLPSISQIANISEQLFIMEDLHNFGADYDKTLMAWHDKFIKAWPDIQKQYDDRFFRMWTYYLLSCAGTFRARTNQLWQIVFSKNGIQGGYIRTR